MAVFYLFSSQYVYKVDCKFVTRHLRIQSWNENELGPLFLYCGKYKNRAKKFKAKKFILKNKFMELWLHIFMKYQHSLKFFFEDMKEFRNFPQMT